MLRVVFLVAFGTFSVAKHLPPYIKTCRKDDPNFDECVKKHASEAIPNILKGDQEFKIPNLEPFTIPEILLDAGSDISIKLNDLVLKGISNIKLEDIKIDIEKQHAYIQFFLKTVSIDGKYDVDGRVLVLPIKGNGPLHIDCQNLIVDYVLDYKLLKKDGREYVDPDVSSKVSYTLEEVNLRLDNLFNGDKELGDRTNEFLNEHALELNNDFSSTLSEVINTVATTIFKKVLPLVPYDEVFP
ncbi:protein takeout-like [Anoplophora glabripennis]|uniref:protein takeout-like n=1 Tax=Anoplophora glabripennis TaxID=217634 RepID=UPI000C76226F|nr:protein takeout-like [Anoplophora glabripennis]